MEDENSGELAMLDITDAKDMDDILTKIVLATESDCEKRGWEDEDSGAFNTWLGVLFTELPQGDEDRHVGPMWITELPRPDVPHLPTLLQFLTQPMILSMLGATIWGNAQDNAVPVGVIATFEGWGIKAGPDKQFTDEEQRAADNHEIHKLAQKIEFRNAVLCMYDGRTVHVTRERGDENLQTQILEKGSTDRRGVVMSHLMQLTRGILGPAWLGD